jgi:hypothetical protein
MVLFFNEYDYLFNSELMAWGRFYQPKVLLLAIQKGFFGELFTKSSPKPPQKL